MRRVLPLLALSLLVVPASAGAAGRPVTVLSAAPSHVTLGAGGSQTIRLSNPGRTAIVVDVSRAGLALDVRGRPRVVASAARSRSAASWLSLRPARIRVPAGGTAALRISAAPPASAEPGDHPALVLLTTRSAATRAVAVRLQVGVAVTVRAPGVVRRRLELRGLRVRRRGRVRTLEVSLANRGNVTEQLPRGRIRIALLRAGRIRTTLRTAPRELLPRTHGVAEVRYAGRLRGALTVRVTVANGPHRSFRLRRF
jgi:hypothetical protein